VLRSLLVAIAAEPTDEKRGWRSYADVRRGKPQFRTLRCRFSIPRQAYAREMAVGDPLEVLVKERKRLIGRIEQETEQLESLQAVVEHLAARIAADGRMLREIDSALGKAPQMKLEDADLRLRGRRLEEIAIAVLAEADNPAEAIHYRDWFEMLRSRGYLVAGKRPVDTFLSQLNRSSAIERIGRRSGLYRLADSAVAS